MVKQKTKTFKVGPLIFESFDVFIYTMAFIMVIFLGHSFRLLNTQQVVLVLLYLGLWELGITYVRKHGLPKPKEKKE